MIGFNTFSRYFMTSKRTYKMSVEIADIKLTEKEERDHFLSRNYGFCIGIPNGNFTLSAEMITLEDMSAASDAHNGMDGGVTTPSAPSVAGYSFVPPLHFVQEVDENGTPPMNIPTLDKNFSPDYRINSRIKNEAFYKNLESLPIQIKQMTYTADDLGVPKPYSMSTMQHRTRGKGDQHDYWNRDIAKQVHSWMKNKPLPDGFMCSITPRSSYAQAVISREKDRKRRKKRHKLIEREDMDVSFESSTYATDSEISTGFDNVLKRKNGLGKTISRVGYKSLSQACSYEDLRRPTEGSKTDRDGKDKRSVFGSVHNEIEFQKRYRRMFDLNKHLQFVNSTNGLKGQRIAKKNNRLPPMTQKRSQALECSEMFAIQSVQKTNDPIEVNIPNPWKNRSYENLSFGQEFEIDTSFTNIENKSQPSSLPNDIIDRFEKLPKITPRVAEVSKTDRTVSSTVSNDLCNFEKSDTSVSDELAEIQEMKVTINIKYKSENSYTPRLRKSSTPRVHPKRVVENEDYERSTPFDKLSYRLNSKTPASGTVSNITCHPSDDDINLTPYDKSKEFVLSPSPDIKMSADSHFLNE